MKPHFFRVAGRMWPPLLTVLTLLSLFAADIQEGNFGAEKPRTSGSSSTGQKRVSYPFSGEVESHDAKSITLKGKRKNRVLLLMPDTRFLKDGAAVKRDLLAPGEYVSGSLRKNPEGKEEALTVNLKGAKPSNPARK
jgi:hypothetical protein